MSRLNVECDIRYKSELRDNVRKNDSIPPGLPHEPTIYRIDGIKITDSVGKIIRKKNNHKELISFLYDIGVSKIIDFDLVHWKGFEQTTTRVPHLLYLWVVTYMSGFCGTNGMRYKLKELTDSVCPCCNQTQVKETQKTPTSLSIETKDNYI